jgi:signal transduction histidine kinase
LEIREEKTMGFQFLQVADEVGRFRGRRLLPAWELTPLHVALVYLSLGTCALFVSDVLLVEYLADPLLTRVQAAKGGLEVLVTTGFVYVLTSGSRAQLQRANDRLDRRREELEDVVRDVLHYTNRAAQIRQISDGNGATERFDLPELLPSIVEHLGPDVREADLRIDVPDHAPVDVNSMFPAAVEELVTNAVVHADAAEPVVEITVDPEGGPHRATTIEVADDGPGVPDDVRRVLAETERDQLVHLDGMGLWFVTWTVADAGGTLDVETNEWGGTTIRVTVPKHVTKPRNWLPLGE